MIEIAPAPDRYDLLSAEFLSEPYPLYARLRADAPVYWSKAQGYWLVSRYAEPELISNVVGVLNAGHETTTNLIGNGVLTLLENPGTWEMLRDDTTLIPRAVEEILRYESPIQMISRIAAERLEIRGVTIGRGEPIALIIGSANRDPEQFSQADQFEISRADNRHVAFGHGPHFCIGGALARVVGQVVFGTLPVRFPSLRLASQRRQWRAYPIFRGLARLPVLV